MAGWALLTVLLAGPLAGSRCVTRADPFPEAQCSFLRSLDEGACHTGEAGCLRALCVEGLAYPSPGCFGEESIGGAATVSPAAIDAFREECEARGRCFWQGGSTSELCDPWDPEEPPDADVVIECFECPPYY